MKIIWRRLLVNPTTHIEAVDGDVVQLRVDGLVCSSVCAVRTKEALEGIEGVRRVEVDFERGVAVVEGAPADGAVYERAVRGVVAGSRVRRAIEHVGRAVGVGRRDVGGGAGHGGG